MLRPIPDLSDVESMAARGRRSALIGARNEAAAELRDIATAVQGADFDALPPLAKQLRAVADRLDEVAALWGSE